MLLFIGCQDSYLRNFSLHMIPVTKVIRHMPPTVSQCDFCFHPQSKTSVADANQRLVNKEHPLISPLLDALDNCLFFFFFFFLETYIMRLVGDTDVLET